MRNMTAEEAQALIFHYAQKLFKDKGEHLKAAYFDSSLANEAKEAILILSDSLDSGIDHLSIQVQKYVYECFVQATMTFSSFQPDVQLPELIEDSMSDDERLSLLLRHGIAEMESPFPVQDIH